ncbi:MAG: hypothetical protein ABIH84_02530 [bacterium]
MEYQTIFKRYDIRGKYPEELNEEVAGALARIYYELVRPTKIILGHDHVLGSEAVCRAFGRALLDLGCERVVYLGTVTTPILYFASAHLHFDHALMFTASHLGEGYTGIKPLKFGLPLAQETLTQMSRIYAQKQVTAINESFPSVSEQELKTMTVLPDYLAALVKLVDRKLTHYQITADAANGPIGGVAGSVFDALGIHYMLINQEVRASHFNHPANPKIKQNRTQLAEAVQEHGSALGVIWDGDCDRCLFVDGSGALISPEFVAVVIARYLNKTMGCRSITADVRASGAMEAECGKADITVKRIKAWHVPIKEEMQKDPTIGFGFEVSGHYVFRDFYRIDDGLLAALLFLAGLEVLGIELKAAWEAFNSTYYIPEELNYQTTVTEETLQRIFAAKYQDGKISLIDGISVDYPAWRFNIRASRTEPLIRLNISGTDKTVVQKQLVEIEREIGGVRI